MALRKVFSLSSNLYLQPAFLTLCLGASAASAVPVTLDNAPDFFSALNSGVVQHFNDFETQPVVGNRTGGGVSSLALPEVMLAAQAPALKILNTAYTGNRNTTQNGRHYLSLDTDVRMGAVMTMTFGQPLYALGFNLIDHDTSDVTLTIGDFSYLLPEVNDGEAVFFGWILDDPMLRIEQISLNSGRDGQIALDDLFFAYWPPVDVPQSIAVPEPAFGFLLIASLLSVLGYRRIS